MAGSEPVPDGDGERITDLLIELRGGHADAMERLFPLVYEELRRIAHRQLQAERPGHTLGTTGLVHETYFKLVDQTRVEWQDRGHFFRVAAAAPRSGGLRAAVPALRRVGARVSLERAIGVEPGPSSPRTKHWSSGRVQ
jgi:hypothetical protein